MKLSGYGLGTDPKAKMLWAVILIGALIALQFIDYNTHHALIGFPWNYLSTSKGESFFFIHRFLLSMSFLLAILIVAFTNGFHKRLFRAGLLTLFIIALNYVVLD